MNKKELERLLEVSTILSSTLDLKKLLGLVLDVATEITDTEDASILLYNPRSRELDFAAFTGDAPLENVTVPMDGSIAGWIVEQSKPVIIDDVQRDVRHFHEIDDNFQFATRTLLGVPLVAHDEPIGVLEVLNKRNGAAYSKQDVALLQALASQAAVAIENARLFQQSDLIAEIMHELKTPLLSMSLSTHLLEREELPEAERERVLHTLRRECERLAKMTADFLDLARLESGRVHLVRDSVALHELVEDVINIEAPQAALRGITIRNNLPTQIPPLTGDADRLKQVLLNLTSNAVKYNREGGDVIISANVAQDGVCLSVADTGPGIAPENLEHLFKRFYRVPTDEYSAGGSGLGLTIARRIVQEHGGRLTVESEVGEGTTFYCWLPFSSVSEVVVAGP